MEPKGSLPFSQKPATWPYSEPAETSSPIEHYLPKVHLRLGLPSGLFTSGLPTKSL